MSLFLLLSWQLIAQAQAADYSDAPISYGDVYHTTNASYYLGATNTSETSSPHNINGDAGDDGVSVPTLIQGQVVSLTIDAVGPASGAVGYLQAWIDWNKDGDFNDAGEQVVTNLKNNDVGDNYNVLSNNTIVVSVTVPSTAILGTTVARFRWSSTSGLTATGNNGVDGEVEDYAVTISSPSSVSCAAITNTLYGNATVGTNNEFQLTPDTGNQLGAIWANNQLNLNSNFDYKTRVYLGNKDGNGADGMAFVLQKTGTSAIGQAGRGVGAGDGNSTGGINPSLIIELDTYQNADIGWADPVDDHLAVYLNGNGRHDTATTTLVKPINLPNIEDNAYHDFRVVWTASSKTLQVYFDGVLKTTTTVDLVSNFGVSSVYWGFTGSTGGLSNRQAVCNQTNPTSTNNFRIAGQVFEDINYGGGNGRNLGVSGGKGTNSAKVELYNSSGTLVGTTTTANDGLNDGTYLFTGLAAGNYYVRVVNSTVKSTRTGNNGTERGVQTYRTDGTTDVTNEIGGRAPNLADAGANTGSETLNTSTFSLSSSGKVQSVQPVAVNNLNISGVMFGFNFDTIVNTNDSGQGSLRQFILNSNLLGNTGLAQSGLTAGLETSIFQIPGTGLFTISPSSALPAITDSYTAVNGSTQIGSSCTASARTLMIALSGTNAGATVSGLTINGANALVKGLAIGNFTDVGVSANSAGSNLTVKCSNIGLNTDGTTAMQNGSFGIYDNAGGNLTIGGTSVDDRNIISGNGRDGIYLYAVNNALIQNNYIGTTANGLNPLSNNQQGADFSGIMLTGAAIATGTKNITVTDNVISGNNVGTGTSANNSKGIKAYFASFITITNNRIGTTPDGLTNLYNTGYGIYLQNATDITIGGLNSSERNIISGNKLDGINTRFGTSRLYIYGNYIGLGSDGTTAIGNGNNGIFLADTSNAMIGNSSASGRNIIGSNSYSGIRNSTSTGTKITDNYVGTDVSGTLDRGNTLHGVYVNNANDVVVGGSNAADGNLIVYNKVIGVFTDKTATNNTNTLVENNYIGMLKDGETIAGNTQAGVETKNNVGVTIRNNLISGNKTRGIHLVSSPNTTITNNRIGTNANGTSDKGNLNHGIDVETAAATLLVNNNVISGNDQSGIRLINGDATGTIITNNRIGTNQDGSSAIANTLDGITVDNVPNFTIGSTTTTGNTISGNNRHGIVIANASTKNLTVVGNLIGLNSAGTAALANANQGIMVQNGATAIKIGDGSAAGSNKIAYNGDNGIILSGTSTNDVSISQNSIYANTTLGIDINLDKVTINDASDSDTGPNAVLNFPLIKSASLNSGNLTLSGCAPTGAILEFFEADVSPTSSSGVSAGANKTILTQDYGEGEQFIARFTEGVGEDTQSPPLDCASLVGADGNSAVGMSPFQWTITTPSTLVSGDKVTATATVTGTGTSEFSGVASALNPIDYADAPASYGTPSHNIVSGIQLGTNIDAEAGAFATADATGDDLDSTDDEDAITSMPSFMQGYTTSVTVKATGAGGYLQAWADWNQNGVFDSSEQVATNIQDGGTGDADGTVDGKIKLTVSVPTTATLGTSFARFRWSTTQSVGATAAANDGEVEDYTLTIARSALCSTIEDKEALFLHDDNGKRIFRIDNVATTPVLDSTPVMSTVAGSAGLTISNNLNGGTPSPTFYVIAGGRYYWFNDSTWVNTSHSVTSYDVAPNPGGGVNYIFSYNGTDVWRYDGTSTPSTPLVTGINASMASYYDVATDAQDNFYIVKSTAGKILKYSKDGVLLATYTAIGMPTGLQPGYAMIGNDMYVFANGGGIYRGVQNNDVVNFSKIATISIPGVTINDIAACPSASIGFQTPKYNLSGVVFEDINYGGGAGRDFTTAAGKGVNGATVELYDSTGKLIDKTTTAKVGTQNGTYSFSQPDGAYYVRVVNDSVNSTRTGSDGTELGVQTYRTNGTTAVTNEIGGHNPSLADGVANTGSETLNTTTYKLSGGANVQSLQPITLAGVDIVNIDFGFNFDTIVNTNDSGQGSLRQFMLNSNLLGNSGLAQALPSAISSDYTTGDEVSIFMIPKANLNGTGGNANTAMIQVNSALPAVTDIATKIDGRTQTLNIEDSNVGQVGTGGTVGTDHLTLSKIDRPEITLDLKEVSILRLSASQGAIRGLTTYNCVPNDYNGCIVADNNANSTVIEHNIIGAYADGSRPVVADLASAQGISLSGQGTVRNNYFAFNGLYHVIVGRGDGQPDSADNSIIENNEMYQIVQAIYYADSAAIYANNVTFQGNLIHGMESNGAASSPSGGKGIEIWYDSDNDLVRNNTITGMLSTAILAGDNSTGLVIDKNQIYSNGGSAVVLHDSSNGQISKNSFWNNSLGIDLVASANISSGDGITTNDANDTDSGGNALLNYPIVASANIAGTNLTVRGCAPTASTIELYEADVSPTSSSGVAQGSNKFGKTQDYGEGERYLTSFVEGVGEDTVTTPVDCSSLTDADGNSAIGMSPFQWTIPIPTGLSVSDLITTTSTISYGSGSSGTSEVTLNTTTLTSEFSATTPITNGHNLVGRVFEDMNYGGGAGRDFTTAAGKGVNGVTVELYKADGTYVTKTTTANDGTQDGVYTFNQVLDGSYYVRVVNDTVNSTRVGSDGTELGVQTFRTDGTTAVTNEVGGHNPSLADGATNTGTETLNTTTYQLSGGANVQSLQAVTLAGADLSGIEFGFNFDTIVNTKANGQGSFAQFLANSNLLKNDNLDQADTLIAIPAGQETTIFMIPTTDTGFVNSPDGGTGKAWLIATGTQYLTMTDANTAVDGSTQTASMGNTNAAVSDITLGSEIIISNSGTPNNSNYGALTIRDTVGFVRNIGITTSSNIAGVTVYQADMTKTLTSGSEITQITSFNVGNSGITLEGAKGVKVENNISRAAGKVNTISDGLIFVNGANQNTVRNNIFHSNSSCGIDLIPSIKNSNNLIESNQIYNNGYGSTSSQEAGICIRSGDSNTIRNNTIYKNKNDGITVMSGNQSNVFTQNAIYQNGNIGIDLGTGSNSLGDGITVNDANDADTGGNNLLNFAMIKQALSVNGKLVIQGCAPSGSTIELYEADVSPTSVSQVAAGSNKFGKTQDYGEGERYLTTFVEGVGEDTVTTPVDCATLTDADGNSAVGMSPFQWTLTMPSNVLIDDKLTVTATNASNTSEFSPVVSLQLYQDRGDASASYGDAAHTINAAVYLGTTLPDMDASSVASTDADGDDISGIDDEDSVSTLPSLYTSSTGTSVNVKVLNSTGNKAWLVGWIDFNKNGVFDSSEAATIPVSSAAQAKTVGLTWANLSGLTAGNTQMRLRLTTDPLIATGVANTSQATGTATDGEVEDYVVTIQQDGAILTGKVFNDANVNGINDTEAGIDNVSVVLKDSTNTCRSVQTQADGSYQFAGLAAGSYTVYEAATANVPVPDTCPPVTADPTGYNSITVNSKTLSIAANATTQQDFGDVASPSFTLDNSLVTQPNTTVVHPHIFRTEVNGEVTLSLIDQNLDPSNLLWESQLLRDANCDSKLNAGDMVITGAISLNAGDKLCVLTKVLTPANASSGATQTLTLQSEFTYGDGSVLTATNKQTHTDTTKVNAASSDTAVSGAGKLDLKKFVWNVTRNQSGETALPGETLRYTIQYENIGNGVLDELAVHDALPNFTDLVAGSPTCVQTPAELSLCTPHVTDTTIDWSYVGKLPTGANGKVSYEVTVQ